MSEMETRRDGDPGNDELPLSFEAWAELSARLSLVSQEQRFDMLDERELDMDAWQRCEAHYALALADDLGQGRMERARHYAATCAAESERRRETSEASPPVAPAPEQIAAEADSTPATARATQTGVPSFLQQHPASPIAIAAVQSVARPPNHLAGTAMAFELPIALRPKAADALPFQAGASPLIAAAAPGATAPLAPAPTGGATLGVGSEVLAQARSTLPFAKPAGEAPRVPYPRMPMQTYASFVAELAVFPEKAAEILQKYNVSSEVSRAALDHEWRTRLEAHADTRTEWEAMVATYRGWLQQQRR